MLRDFRRRDERSQNLDIRCVPREPADGARPGLLSDEWIAVAGAAGFRDVVGGRNRWYFNDHDDVARSLRRPRRDARAWFAPSGASTFHRLGDRFNSFGPREGEGAGNTCNARDLGSNSDFSG